MNDQRVARSGKASSAVRDGASPSDLATMRAQLDRIDERLLECIRDRIDCCRSIGVYKRRYAVPMMQQHRIDFVQGRAARFGREHGVSLDFLRKLYAVIVDETCRVESLLISGAVADEATSRGV